MASKYGEIHVDKFLTDLSIKYGNGALIADEVFPRKPVMKRSDQYVVYGKQDRRIHDAIRAAGSPAGEALAMSIESTPTYYCEEYALKDKVTREDEENADKPIEPMIDVTMGLTNQLLVAREKRVADLCTAAATFSTSGNTTTLSGVQQWNNATFSTSGTSIETRIDNAKEAIRATLGVEPNNIVIPAAVAKVMKRDSAIRDIIKYTDQTLLVNGELPRTLWNMNVIIPGAVYDSANQGASYSGADVWGKHVLLFFRTPGVPRIRQVSFGITFENKTFSVQKWFEQNIESTWVQASHKLNEKVVSEYAGYLYRNVIA